MPACGRCNEAMGLWDIEVRDGYKCWKCAQPMRILLVFSRGRTWLRSVYPISSELAYRRPESLIPLAAKYGVRLERRYSQTVQDRYIMHICPHCGSGQGDNYVVEDMEQVIPVVKAFPAVSCRKCKYWQECS